MTLPWLVAGWIGGIAAAGWLPLPAWQWLALALTAVGFAVATRPDRRFLLLFAVAASGFLGSARASLALQGYARALPVELRDGGSMVARGTVASLPQIRRDGIAFEIETSQLGTETDPQEARVRVRVVTAPTASPRRGDIVLIHARWRAARGSDQMRLAGEAIGASVTRLRPGEWRAPVVLLDNARGALVDRLRQVFPEAEAWLVSGVLLGADQGMPAETLNAFRTTGTAHILAVSGFNVTLVAAAAIALFRPWLGARKGMAAAGAAVAGYTLLTGADPPVVRAAIMAGVSLVALRLGRQGDGLTSLAAAAWLMSLADPSVVADLGFQLSFLATLYLVLFASPTQARLDRWLRSAVGAPGPRAVIAAIAETLVLTLIAQAATLPLSAYVFHTLPLSALPANLLILPAQPALMATGGVAAAAAAINVGLGRLGAWLALPFASYTLHVAQWFAALPGASLELAPFSWPVLALGYLPLLMAAAPRLTAVPLPAVARRLAGPAGLVLLIALVTLAWRSALDRPDGRIHLFALPGGDVVIETPTGRFLAVVGSGASDGPTSAVEAVLPPTHRVLDWIIAPAATWDAETGPAAWGRFAPRGVIIQPPPNGGGPGPSGSWPRLVAPASGLTLALAGRSTLEVEATGPAGTSLSLTFGRATFHIVVIQDANRASPVDLRDSAATALILVGLSGDLERWLERPERLAGVRVLVVSPLPGSLLREDPSLPAGVVRLTSAQGVIHIASDGESLSVTAQRRP